MEFGIDKNKGLRKYHPSLYGYAPDSRRKRQGLPVLAGPLTRHPEHAELRARLCRTAGVAGGLARHQHGVLPHIQGRTVRSQILRARSVGHRPIARVEATAKLFFLTSEVCHITQVDRKHGRRKRLRSMLLTPADDLADATLILPTPRAFAASAASQAFQ
jgi:hypothetical protein